MRSLLLASVAVCLALPSCASTPIPETRAGSSNDRKASPDRRAAVFRRNGCDGCHSVTALGVSARDSTAPDLSLAAARVPALYGVSLARFLEEPTGTMAVVLDLEIDLAPADRDSIVVILERVALAAPPNPRR